MDNMEKRAKQFCRRISHTSLENVPVLVSVDVKNQEHWDSINVFEIMVKFACKEVEKALAEHEEDYTREFALCITSYLGEKYGEPANIALKLLDAFKALKERE